MKLNPLNSIDRFRPYIVGAVFGLGFAFLYTWIFAVCAAVYAVHYTFKEEPQRPFLWWWKVAFIKQLVVMSWFWSAYPLDWIGVDSSLAQVFFIALYWIPAAALSAIGYGFLGSLFLKFRTATYVAPSLIVSGWLFADMFGALLVSVAALGPGVSLNASFSFGWVGYALVSHPLLLQAAHIYGVYVLSILFGMIVCGGWWLVSCKKYYLLGLLSLILLTTAWLEVPRSDDTKEGVKIAVVTTNFDRVAKPNALDLALKKSVLTQVAVELMNTEHEYVIFPEDLRFMRRLASTTALQNYVAKTREENIVIVDTNRIDTEKTTLQGSFYDLAEREEPYHIEKQYLVPQGEYIPYVYRLFYSLFSLSDDTKYLLASSNYEPGTDQSEVVFPEHIPALLFCSESIHPRGVLNSLKNKKEVPFVAHVVSRAWFARPSGVLQHELSSMLKVQAVWSDFTIVQSSNVVTSRVFYKNGREEVIQEKVISNSYDVKVVEI